MSDMWSIASTDVESEQRERLIATARIACAQHFAFASEASSAGEFDDRLSLVADKVESVIARLTTADPTLFPIVHAAVLESWDDDFASLTEARQVEARKQAAAKVTQRTAANPLDPANAPWNSPNRPYLDENGQSTDFLQSPEFVPNPEEWIGPDEDGLYRINPSGWPKRQSAKSTCRNCDKPIPAPGYCSDICREMDRFPPPRDDQEARTTPRTAGYVEGVDCPMSEAGWFTDEPFTGSAVCPTCGQTVPVSDGGIYYDTDTDTDRRVLYPSVHLLPGKRLSDRISSLTKQAWNPTTPQIKNSQAPVPPTVGHRECDTTELKRQIGNMNILAISGGRILPVFAGNGTKVGISMPVSSGYSVNVVLNGDDTYIVQRVLNGRVVGQQTDVYFDEVGEAAYQASSYKSNDFGGHVAASIDGNGPTQFGPDVQSQSGFAESELPQEVGVGDAPENSNLGWVNTARRTAASTPEYPEIDEALSFPMSGGRMKYARDAGRWVVIDPSTDWATVYESYDMNGVGTEVNWIMHDHSPASVRDAVITGLKIRRSASLRTAAYVWEPGDDEEGWSEQSEVAYLDNEWGDYLNVYFYPPEQTWEWSFSQGGPSVRTSRQGSASSKEEAKAKAESAYRAAGGSLDLDGSVWSSGTRTAHLNVRVNPAVHLMNRTAGENPFAKKDEKDADPKDKKPKAEAEEEAGEESEEEQASAAPAQQQPAPQAPAQPAPAQPDSASDPAAMTVGQKSNMTYTMADGNNGSLEVVFVREENGVYFFNGPTGEFGVANTTGAWNDADGNTFTFAMAGNGGAAQQAQPAPAAPAAPAEQPKADGGEKKDDPTQKKSSRHTAAGQVIRTSDDGRYRLTGPDDGYYWLETRNGEGGWDEVGAVLDPENFEVAIYEAGEEMRVMMADAREEFGFTSSRRTAAVDPDLAARARQTWGGHGSEGNPLVGRDAFVSFYGLSYRWVDDTTLRCDMDGAEIKFRKGGPTGWEYKSWDGWVPLERLKTESERQADFDAYQQKEDDRIAWMKANDPEAYHRWLRGD